MLELTADIALSDRDALEAFLFDTEVEHPWILCDDLAAASATVQGIFASEAEARAAWRALAAHLGAPSEPRLRELEDKDWKESYKEHFHPWSSGTLHWVPLWLKDEYELPAGHEAVWLDPGMAFGTGNHETTRLCLERLLEVEAPAEGKGALRLIDAGTGSGILAISAVKLGYTQVSAFDNDPEAVRVACENAVLNGALSLRFDVADLETGFREAPFDVILANILGPVLVAHRQALVGALADGGTLILSGILATEAEKIAEPFRPLRDWASVELNELGEWSSVTLRG